MFGRHLQTAFVIFSNLYPFYGLFYLEWSPFSIALLYVVETFILLFFLEIRTILKAINGYHERLIETLLLLVPVVVFSTLHIALSTMFYELQTYHMAWNTLFSVLFSALSIGASAIFILFLRHLLDFILYVKSGRHTFAGKDEQDKSIAWVSYRLFFMQVTVILGSVVGGMLHNINYGICILITLSALFNLNQYRKFYVTES